MYTSPTVSHHPPISAFFYISPENRISIVGELRPKSKFLGNSVSTTMEGDNRITLLGIPDDGGSCFIPPHVTISRSSPPEYVVTMPNMYARGILFGKMVLELGDTCTVKNESRRLSCDLEFKTKVCPPFPSVGAHGCLTQALTRPGFLLWHVQRDCRTRT